MSIDYAPAPDLEKLAKEIALTLGMDHLRMDRLACVRSKGSRSMRTIARIHSISKIWKVALGIDPSYVIEAISERFDELSQEGKEKTIIHELLHVPKSFGGGFRYHGDYVTSNRVNRLHSLLREMRERKLND